jgi:hypothetical protein
MLILETMSREYAAPPSRLVVLLKARDKRSSMSILPIEFPWKASSVMFITSQSVVYNESLLPSKRQFSGKNSIESGASNPSSMQPRVNYLLFLKSSSWVELSVLSLDGAVETSIRYT